MSSCYKKRPNIEKYGEPPRTPYDQLMNKVYSPQSYNAAPFPMPRTEFDMKMQQHWCPKCGYGFIATPSKDAKNILDPATTEFYANPPRTPYDQLMNQVYSPQAYNAAPFPMERTVFDMDLIKVWCPKCNYGFTPTPPKGAKNVLNPGTTEFFSVSRENFCGAPNNVALALQDNDNVWSYGAKQV